MAIDRRRFLLSSAGITAASCLPVGLSWAGEVPVGGRRRIFGAALDSEGRYILASVAAGGGDPVIVPLPGRGHGPAVDPTGRWVVMLARRPGTFMVVADAGTGAMVAQHISPARRHFFGHGVFSPDGRFLYTTENDIETGKGVIGVWDMSGAGDRVAEFPSYGIGPHQLVLHPDGETLIIANGGIETHPDTGRRKLNIATMQPSLAYVDRRTGALAEKRQMPDELHKLSIRHLDVSQDGLVGLAFQYQGPRTDTVPMVGFHRRGEDIEFAQASANILRHMKHYCASVGFDRSGRWLGVTAPRGNIATVWDVATRTCGYVLGVPDAGGVVATDRDGAFVFGTGTGLLVTAEIRDGRLTETHRSAASGFRGWDNHLLAV